MAHRSSSEGSPPSSPAQGTSWGWVPPPDMPASSNVPRPPSQPAKPIPLSRSQQPAAGGYVPPPQPGTPPYPSSPTQTYPPQAQPPQAQTPYPGYPSGQPSYPPYAGPPTYPSNAYPGRTPAYPSYYQQPTYPQGYHPQGYPSAPSYPSASSYPYASQTQPTWGHPQARAVSSVAWERLKQAQAEEQAEEEYLLSHNEYVWEMIKEGSIIVFVILVALVVTYYGVYYAGFGEMMERNGIDYVHQWTAALMNWIQG